jgi:hypothetical protein
MVWLDEPECDSRKRVNTDLLQLGGCFHTKMKFIDSDISDSHSGN